MAYFLDGGFWQGAGGVFVWRAGAFSRLTTSVSRGAAVNRHGLVVGSVGTLFEGFLPPNGRIWRRGRTISPGVSPQDVNDRGQVAGRATVNDQIHAALWENGRVTDLGTPGGTFSTAIAINERGQVLGSGSAADGTDHPFLWSNGRMIELTSAEGPTSVSQLNDVGQVLGTVQRTPPPPFPPFPTTVQVMWTIHDDDGGA